MPLEEEESEFVKLFWDAASGREIDFTPDSVTENIINEFFDALEDRELEMVYAIILHPFWI